MDIQALMRAREERLLQSSIYGQPEDPLTTAPEVKQQVNYNTSMTLAPVSKKEERQVDEAETLNPKVVRMPLERGKSYEQHLKETDILYQRDRVRINRKPNAWDTLCNYQIPINVVVTGWNAKPYLDTILVFNQSTSAGSVYVSSSQERLLTNPIRGMAIPPGGQFTLETEAAGFLIAPQGAIVDIVWTWHEGVENAKQ